MPFPFPVSGQTDAFARPAAGETVNSLLMHGARFHERDCLLHELDLVGQRLVSHPDWRLDRAAIRVGLVLSEQLGVGSGGGVGIHWSLGRDLIVIERASAALGAHTVVADAEVPVEALSRLVERRPRVLFVEDPSLLEQIATRPSSRRDLESIHAVIGATPHSFGETLERLLEAGGVLDTAERATVWRRRAREVADDTLFSLEWDGTSWSEWSQRRAAQLMSEIAEAHPPKPLGRHFVLAPGLYRAPIRARAVLYAGWADGWSQIAAAPSKHATDGARLLSPSRIFGQATDPCWSDVSRLEPEKIDVDYFGRDSETPTNH